MKVVVDALAVRRGSAAIVIGNLLNGWTEVAPADSLSVLVAGEPEFPVPPGVDVVRLGDGGSALGGAWARTVGVRRACARFGADALLGAVTAGSLLGTSCRRAVIVHDLRHELRPEQFSPLRRAVRRVAYGLSFRTADVLLCNSARTRADVLRGRPALADKTRVMLLGADHVDSWAAGVDPARPQYVLAFGHFANKNVEAVLRGWAAFAPVGVELHVCGLAGPARVTAQAQVRSLGVTGSVRLLPWLSDGEFRAEFAGAAAVLLPSDFEGFGLPAVEALRLGVPVVISSDPALLEVTGGHAVVADPSDPSALARAIAAALERSPAEIAAGRAHAAEFTWARAAAVAREALVGRQPPSRFAPVSGATGSSERR